MLLFILRHGDPIYDPDSLTERGKLQAEALAKRLALYGIDKIYSSPLIRAQQTAEPTVVLTGKKPIIEEWTSEALAWDDFSIDAPFGRTWIFHSPLRSCLRSKEIDALSKQWYKADLFDERFERGYKRLLNASDEFLARHGYRHDSENNRYIAENPTDERIAVFCHQGFGLSWLGTLLDIPLPMIWTNFDISHTGMTVIEFSAKKGEECLPMVLSLANDSHLYREGLPTKYQNRIYF